MNQNLQESQKGVYELDVEKNFAIPFENNQMVKVYAKLPSSFKIETPLGNYNPDWAVSGDRKRWKQKALFCRRD